MNVHGRGDDRQSSVGRFEEAARWGLRGGEEIELELLAQRLDELGVRGRNVPIPITCGRMDNRHRECRRRLNVLRRDGQLLVMLDREPEVSCQRRGRGPGVPLSYELACSCGASWRVRVTTLARAYVAAVQEGRRRIVLARDISS